MSGAFRNPGSISPVNTYTKNTPEMMIRARPATRRVSSMIRATPATAASEIPMGAKGVPVELRINVP